jgi:hypothetical protein
VEGCVEIGAPEEIDQHVLHELLVLDLDPEGWRQGGAFEGVGVEGCEGLAGLYLETVHVLSLEANL